MAKSEIEAITIVAAVARMVNLDFMPSDATPFDVADYLEILRDHAEADYENARAKKISEEHLKLLHHRWIACKERLCFAISIQQALEQEVKCPEHSSIEVVGQSEGMPLLSVKSLSYWAKRYFRTYISDWKSVQTATSIITSWEDCEIRIHKNFQISLFNKGLPHTHSSFQKLGLWRTKDNLPNKEGQILIWLSEKKSTSDFTSDRRYGAKHGVIPTDMSRLGKALGKLTGLSDKAFRNLGGDNYKPYFQLLDRRRASDESAKWWAEKYGMVSLDTAENRLAQGVTRDFDIEKDAAQRFIDENE